MASHAADKTLPLQARAMGVQIPHNPAAVAQERSGMFSNPINVVLAVLIGVVLVATLVFVIISVT
jgi:hypothetical protein